MPLTTRTGTKDAGEIWVSIRKEGGPAGAAEGMGLVRWAGLAGGRWAVGCGAGCAWAPLSGPARGGSLEGASSTRQPMAEQQTSSLRALCIRPCLDTQHPCFPSHLYRAPPCRRPASLPRVLAVLAMAVLGEPCLNHTQA